ncbi:MAG: SDR family oxidoreductase [Hyphomicrobiales bacterium]|nr:MAG: SDR family oxidoreductase [Hyphomicrobiales bacterium]
MSAAAGSRRFEGATVIVSGGSRGMGESHVRGFLAEGAQVVIGDVLDAAGYRLADKLGDDVRFVHLDVTSQEDWAGAVQLAEDSFGPVSVLVNNAGIQSFVTIEDSRPSAWRRELDINLTGQYLGIRAVIPSMRRRGHGAIVNVSSAGAFTGAAASSAYIASKWGVRGLTKTAAIELGHEGIRVNVVVPGYTQTAMTEDYLDAYPSSEFAIPHVGQPADITRMVLFAASDEASFSTGVEFVADGGWLLGPAMTPPDRKVEAESRL